MTLFDRPDSGRPDSRRPDTGRRRWGRGSTMLAGFVIAATLPMASAWAQDDLTLRRVMLSTGGVGYFEYEATISGDAALTLDVRLDQVNDILKSIVVYDDQGGIGEISLPGREPLSDVFRELPFGPEALSSPVALFNALRGAEVEARGSRNVTGRLIAVTAEQVQLPNNGGLITQHRVSLMTAIGVQQLILEEADALSFVDPELQEQVSTALAALAQHNERDRREISVQTFGEAERTVRVAYVVEVPLWKSSYRLTMSDDPAAETAELQGWAVIENMSGENWADVDLTVVSGNPVTFQQALYQSYYVDRPMVPVEVLGRVMPRLDTGAIDMRDQSPAPPPAAPMPDGLGRIEAEQAVAGMMAPADTAEEYFGGDAIGYDMDDQPMGQAQIVAAASVEATTQVMFQFPEPITVDSGHSVLVPIVSREIPAERLSLYQPDTHPTHPLASVRLTNDSGSGLPPGVLTIYERTSANGLVAFVGDARLAALPVGEERLLSFAVDQKVKVLTDSAGSQEIASGRIVDGVLILTLQEQSTTTYTIDGAATEPRVVMIEHARPSGWELIVDETLEVEMTDNHYRIEQPVGADETVEVEVTLERPISQRVELLNMSSSLIEFYSSAEALSDEARAAIAEMAEYRAVVAEIDREISTLEDRYREVVTDQARIRENLDTIPRDTDLYQRYLDQLATQEDELGALAVSLADAKERLAEAREVLGEYVVNLNYF